MARLAKIGLLLALVCAVGLGNFAPAQAGKPFCNIVEQTEVMFTDNWFGVRWLGSPQLSRAFVVWPLDDRAHWAAYELWMDPESFEKTGEHKGWALLTGLPADTWKAGQLIVILEENSAQERHSPPQEPGDEHGRLLVLLGLVPPSAGEVPPTGAPLCKIYLDPVQVLPRP
jgi:hypothetical protein